MSTSKYPVLTVGHSTHSAEAFEALLKQHGVTTVADVRSAPYSRFNPQFNREVLERYLIVRGMKYVFLGRELGARSDDRSCYENGRVLYARLACTESFRSGIDRVAAHANEDRVALLCAEKEPLECHRTLLVARALVRRGIFVGHILMDGRLEAHDATIDRLFGVLHLSERDLFRSRAELIDEAFVRQEQRVAYIDEKLVADAAQEIP